jgi:hypothetical protein
MHEYTRPTPPHPAHPLMCAHVVAHVQSSGQPQLDGKTVPAYSNLGYESEAKHHFPLGDFASGADNVFVTPEEHLVLNDAGTSPTTPHVGGAFAHRRSGRIVTLHR